MDHFYVADVSLGGEILSLGQNMLTNHKEFSQIQKSEIKVWTGGKIEQ